MQVSYMNIKSHYPEWEYINRYTFNYSTTFAAAGKMDCKAV